MSCFFALSRSNSLSVTNRQLHGSVIVLSINCPVLCLSVILARSLLDGSVFGFESVLDLCRKLLASLSLVILASLLPLGINKILLLYLRKYLSIYVKYGHKDSSEFIGLVLK